MWWIIPALVIGGIVNAVANRKSKTEKEREKELNSMVGSLKEMKKVFKESGKYDLISRCEELIKEANEREDDIISDGEDNIFYAFKAKYNSVLNKYESMF